MNYEYIEKTDFFFFLDKMIVESSQNLKFSFLHIIFVNSLDLKEESDWLQ